MERRIERSYAFHDREIREALIAALKAKDIPAPDYIGDTPTCKWVKEPEGLRVTWIDEGEINVGAGER